jgi:hypothetical protein
MKRNKLRLVLLILAAATVAWTIRQQQLQIIRRDMAEMEAQAMVADERIRTAEEEMSAAQSRLAAEKLGQQRALAEAAKAARELAKRDPESLWSSPPATLPEWNAESPFVWLRKEIISKLPVKAFQASGELRPEVAYVLTLAPAQQTALNAALKRCLEGYRQAETASVERLDEHLPNVAGQEGAKLTIRVTPVPEEGAQARREFEAALRNVLGDQRADLLLQVSRGWLTSEFGQPDAKPESKTISLVRNPDGNLFLSIKTGGSSQSMGVDKNHLEVMNEYLPPHLLPFFREFLETPGDTSPAP